MNAENDSAISQKMKNHKSNSFLALGNRTRLFFGTEEVWNLCVQNEKSLADHQNSFEAHRLRNTAQEDSSPNIGFLIWKFSIQGP